MLRPARSNGSIPGSTTRKGIWFVVAATAPAEDPVEAMQRRMDRPLDLRQWLAGCFYTIQSALRSYWIVSKAPNNRRNNASKPHESSF